MNNMDNIDLFLRGEVVLDVLGSESADVLELSSIIDEKCEFGIVYGGSITAKVFYDYWKECFSEKWETIYAYEKRTDEIHISANRLDASERLRETHPAFTAKELIGSKNSFTEIKEDEIMSLFEVE